MQVHDKGRAAPGMTWTVQSGALFCMQIHARYACTNFYNAAGQKKGLGKKEYGRKKAAGVAAALRN